MFDHLHPLNAAGLVINSAMMLTLVIVISLGRRKLRQKRRSRPTLTLLSEPGQCVAYFRRLRMGIPASLPAISKEDHL